jgi:hypothetical protein
LEDEKEEEKNPALLIPPPEELFTKTTFIQEDAKTGGDLNFLTL